VRDGGLASLFKSSLPAFHWQSVETWSTGQGVPDLNYCSGGVEGWVELKQTPANAVKVGPEQVAWIERRLRKGGRVYLAVRNKAAAGLRRPAKDLLLLYKGDQVRALSQGGLSQCLPIAFWSGGPPRWNWDEVSSILLS
jgi:hypothetical protein